MPLTRDSHSVLSPNEKPVTIPAVASDSPMFTDTPVIHTVKQHEADSYARLLQLNMCYEAMPTSSKIVVFDANLKMEKAFNGLIFQNTRHVLISKNDNGQVIGILSVTDFIRVLLKKWREHLNDSMEVDCADIADMTISQYRELAEADGKILNLITIQGNQSILEAARLLAQYRIHRLPVMDPVNGSPLFILTHKRILKFLWCFGSQFSLPEYHVKTPKALGVGTWDNLRLVYEDTPLHECLTILSTENISGVPVLQRGTDKVMGMYSRFDAIAIAAENDPHYLERPVVEALNFKNFSKDADFTNLVVSIGLHDTFWQAVEVLVERSVHRLCVLNDAGQVEGLISLADVINYMVVKPGAHLESPKPHHLSRMAKVEDLSNEALRRILAGNNDIDPPNGHH
ncbi:unnamed protein product, partial [Mesorhabditis spiculigera]